MSPPGRAAAPAGGTGTDRQDVEGHRQEQSTTPGTDDRMTCAEALTLAHKWAARGVHAFPIAISWDNRKQSTNKVPLTEHGHHDATTDPAELERLFNRRSPKPGEVWGVGLWPGPSGHLVLDPDVKGGHRGDEELAALEAEHGHLDTMRAVTASGGGHVWLTKPAGVHVGNEDLVPNEVEVRSDDGWVVAIGTRTPWGSWDHDEATPKRAAAAPGWLLDRLTRASTNGNGAGHWEHYTPEGLHPADVATLKVLTDRFGAHSPFLKGGYVQVSRPGKDAGGSASIGYVAPGVVKVFTTDWPPFKKNGVYDLDQLEKLAQADQTPEVAPDPVSLGEAEQTFRRWLGDEYDIDALRATLATAAAERLGGDPLWILLVSGSGNAKTETVQALRGSGAHVVSTITSDGALLSGSPNKQRAKNATGGLLRQVGDHGLLVIKDVTSILSMNRDARASVLAAIREIHDGRWIRYLGVDGGRSLEWTGRIGIVGAVTTAWDRAHDVIASMGDRFLILRMDSTEGRIAAGRQSRRNVDHEEQMRAELADAVAGVLAGASTDVDEVTDDEGDRLLAAADVVTLARTGVEYDYRGDVIDAHAPEMPTRFTKQLVQMVRGAVSIGMRRDDAMRLAIRCARDSMPPLRLAILDDVAAHPGSLTHHVRKRLGKPRATVDRQLQSLHMLGVFECDEVESPSGTRWYYRVADGIDPTALVVPDLSPPTHKPKEKQANGQTDALGDTSDISGTTSRGIAGGTYRGTTPDGDHLSRLTPDGLDPRVDTEVW